MFRKVVRILKSNENFYCFVVKYFLFNILVKLEFEIMRSSSLIRDSTKSKFVF